MMGMHVCLNTVSASKRDLMSDCSEHLLKKTPAQITEQLFLTIELDICRFILIPMILALFLFYSYFQCPKNILKWRRVVVYDS